ncbi:hypothetical protein A2W54_03805 [Candidatus Giovannonibacteria bacterium RIFCSPHIGHO2_02_43_13]|uniref:NAD kinase n=1 Tax=Candidatus Giovannonibacteria bacterium RIFCSPHIGHO2_02_43_13 TaxID=1798330 RepID=A0A1F5WRE5_9BACT|nr:MAG: putative inorganic polyphosphate/ATP-NAD kinase [Parcubacteria group bacterium GW2011_GWA2_44_13]OGF74645.1 MAG: hypothetical protein A3E06_02915 [Candidatus Giovannonibacteria bacterium RIFCSPHIGHO2_12_FULL_44_42]OGF78200.1 MAG: hypothetical protein A2W54_03805 [Candidatus Giovannonibacteria bacterium RIFCSPHIGHO2_02_43_13]OGF90066.1 MAG: hypothetical protein A3I94_03020 [Candidatus Giovannonibacteria bacterium RIFCSPLOWO2_02_FULL_43_54]OGF96608.1 MAG: hypothetical protein A3H08_01560 
MLKRVSIYFRNDNPRSVLWGGKITKWINANYPKVLLSAKKPQVVIAAGGDGTLLEAAQKFKNPNPAIFGLNTGHVGFLASVRDEKDFFKALRKLFKGEYRVSKKMMIKAEVWRRGRKILDTNALNEISIQNPLGMVELEVAIDGHPFQYIHGTGVMVATATGSTAYNLSAHGPIIMPDIKCMVLTEIMDHNIPTPSIVIKRDREVEIKVLDFRKRGLIKIAKTGVPADVLITADIGESLMALEKGDVIKIKRTPLLVKFAELERGYFFKSLQEKFGFR